MFFLGLMYPRAFAIGATSVCRISGGWGNEGLIPGSSPTNDGTIRYMPNWLATVTTLLNNIQAAGYVVHYDIWNEPDLGSFWAGTQAQFFEMWRQTHLKIRELQPGASIIGPSLAYYDATWMGQFLDYVKANNVVPDVLNWHEWTYTSIPGNHANAVALLAARSIPLTRFGVAEYVSENEQFLPDRLVGFLQRLESVGVEFAGHACWPDPGMGGASNCVSAVMNGIVTNESPKRPRSTWWVYKGYADISGRLVGVTQLNGTSTIAGKDSALGTANVLIGNHGGVPVDVQFTNLSSSPYLIIGGQVRVKAYRIANNSYNAVPTLPTMIDSDYAVVGDSITVGLPSFAGGDAYIVQLVGTQDLIPQVNLATEELGWDWSQGAGGAVETFTIKPGSVGSSFSEVTVSGLLRQYPLRDVIAATGLHSFRVQAVNAAGAALDSNELVGDVVGITVPTAPTNLRLIG